MLTTKTTTYWWITTSSKAPKLTTNMPILNFWKSNNLTIPQIIIETSNGKKARVHQEARNAKAAVFLASERPVTGWISSPSCNSIAKAANQAYEAVKIIRLQSSQLLSFLRLRKSTRAAAASRKFITISVTPLASKSNGEYIWQMKATLICNNSFKRLRAIRQIKLLYRSKSKLVRIVLWSQANPQIGRS